MRDKTTVHVLAKHYGTGGFQYVYAMRLYLAGLIDEDTLWTYTLIGK